MFDILLSPNPFNRTEEQRLDLVHDWNEFIQNDIKY